MGYGSQTQGAIYRHQLKSLDWQVCLSKIKETLPDVITEDVAARIEAILFD